LSCFGEYKKYCKEKCTKSQVLCITHNDYSMHVLMHILRPAAMLTLFTARAGIVI